MVEPFPIASAGIRLLAGGWRLACYDTLPSTSDLCRERAQAGEAAGLAVLAAQQSRGRGSQGRSWVSPPGNLYLSVLLRPHGIAREAGQWALLAGVALAEAAASWLGEGAALRLKWPNDLLLDGAKLAGILIDSSAVGTRLDWLVVGIGVNLASAPDLPGRRTICLADHGAAIPAEAAAGAILGRLGWWDAEQADNGFTPIRAAWQRWGEVPAGVADLGETAVLPARAAEV